MNSSSLVDDNPAHEFPTLSIISAWFGVLLVGLTAASSLFLGQKTSTNPFMATLQFVLFAFILASVVYLVLGADHNARVAAVPLLINLGTLIIIRFVPFAGLWESIRFQWRWQAYNEVVTLVESGQIPVNEQGQAALPSQYRYLSAEGGQIMVSDAGGVTTIFLFTARHAPRVFAGYLYRSDDSPPQAGDFGGRWHYVVQKRPHWFFCVSR